MKINYRLLVALISFFIVWKIVHHFTERHDTEDVILEEDERFAGRVKVSVYYEALCSDSRFFILKQLIPAYETVPSIIQLDLVPYGKAKTFENNGKITFECQHAALECLANKIHVCGIHYIKEPALQLKYIACMIDDNMIPDVAAHKCAEDLGIDNSPIMKCAEENEGSLLLKAYGERTHSLNPPATFIPTVELNDSQTVPQTLILKNLLKELCSFVLVKPKGCNFQ